MRVIDSISPQTCQPALANAKASDAELPTASQLPTAGHYSYHKLTFMPKAWVSRHLGAAPPAPSPCLRHERQLVTPPPEDHG